MTWYNPFTWFRSTDTETTDDQSYEDGVQERCDHEFEVSTELLDTVALHEMELVGDYLVFPQYESVEEHCKNCGAPGYKGEYDEPPTGHGTYAAPAGHCRRGERVRVANRIAIPIERLDPGQDPTDAFVDNTTVIEGEGDGRVLVNEQEQERDADGETLPVIAEESTDE